MAEKTPEEMREAVLAIREKMAAAARFPRLHLNAFRGVQAISKFD